MKSSQEGQQSSLCLVGVEDRVPPTGPLRSAFIHTRLQCPGHAAAKPHGWFADPFNLIGNTCSQPINQPSKQSTNQPINQPTNQVSNQASNQSKQPINQPIKKAIKQSAKQSSKQSVNQSRAQKIHRSTAQNPGM